MSFATVVTSSRRVDVVHTIPDSVVQKKEVMAVE